jgi:hypothetical protein
MIRTLKIGSALLCIIAIPTISGCANCRAGTRVTTVSSKCNLCKSSGCRFGQCKDTVALTTHKQTEFKLTGDLPANAKVGECYAKVFVPPQFNTVTERVCVREASERLEILPAQYEWVEEQVLVKEASTELVEVPARFETREAVVQTNPGHTTWTKQTQARCVADNNAGPPPQDIFCLVSAPPTTTTIQTECMVEPAKVEQRNIPAEYSTIRKQVCVKPATTRRIEIPAEYRDIEKTVMTSPGHMQWQRVDCDIDATAHGELFRMETETRIMPVRDTNVDFVDYPKRDIDVDIDADLDDPDLDDDN